MIMVGEAATDVGAVRTRNEDSLVCRDDAGLWAVADGAGGHGAGDVASQAVAEALSGLPRQLSAAELLAQVRLRLDAVHAELQEQAAAAGPGRILASTVVVLLARGGHYAALWAGDSRIYLLRGGEFRRVTRDHSVVQEMVDAGTLTEEEAEAHPQANVITRAIGARGELQLDKLSDRILPGDVFLLCSDGLFKALPEHLIGERLRQGASGADLVREAVAAGARDNVTAVVVRVR
ncbi:MAG: PP2C family protein-serine/threonine phosphatase [Acetobacteraceae bacterium]